MAEERLASKRQAGAEAKEIRMRELEKQKEELCDAPMKMKIKKVNKTPYPKESRKIRKNSLPKNHRYDSKYISPSRITTKHGLYNYEKISELATCHEGTADEMTKTRGQEDLHEILMIVNRQWPLVSEENNAQEKDFSGSSNSNVLKNLPRSCLTPNLTGSPPRKVRCKKPLCISNNSASVNSPVKTMAMEISPKQTLQFNSPVRPDITNYFTDGPFTIIEGSSPKDEEIFPKISDQCVKYFNMWVSYLDKENQANCDQEDANIQHDNGDNDSAIVGDPCCSYVINRNDSSKNAVPPPSSQASPSSQGQEYKLNDSMLSSSSPLNQRVFTDGIDSESCLLNTNCTLFDSDDERTLFASFNSQDKYMHSPYDDEFWLINEFSSLEDSPLKLLNL